jgi:hypothetical protein
LREYRKLYEFRKLVNGIEVLLMIPAPQGGAGRGEGREGERERGREGERERGSRVPIPNALGRVP